MKDLTYKGRVLSLKKAIEKPDFSGRSVISEEPWNYVGLWLRRNAPEKAIFYWEQAQDFYIAAQRLPDTSAPLAGYYCILNAVKALLTSKKRKISPNHGVHGESQTGNRSLGKELIEIDGKGVLRALMEYLGEKQFKRTISMKLALQNLPYIHNAFCLTYSSEPELFIPISNPKFVKKEGSHECWFMAELMGKDATHHNIEKLPSGYERDKVDLSRYIIRKKKRFDWYYGAKHERANLDRLTKYHRVVRKQISYILGPKRIWYLKRKNNIPPVIECPNLVLTYVAMHRLSELCRYDPFVLSRHYDCQHQWLISEFISFAPRQFIDEIAADITGKDFMIAGLRQE